MKKIIASLGFMMFLTSCSEPSLKSQNTYLVDWDSNQTEPSAKFSILRKGQMVAILETTSKHFECALKPDDAFVIGISPKEATPRPFCYLKISKRGDFDPTTGVYQPDKIKVLYEQEAATNSFGYSGIVLNNGDLK